jgi:hypothetical protein
MIFKRYLIVVGLLGSVGNSVNAGDPTPDSWREAVNSWKTIDQQSTTLDYELWKAKIYWERSSNSWQGISVNTRKYEEMSAQAKWDKARREWGKFDNWKTAKGWFRSAQDQK